MSVTLYTQPGCGPCTAVKAALTRYKILFTEVNVRDDETAFNRVKALGYNGTPVIETAAGDHWDGFNLQNIKLLAEASVAA